jgi:hypothetical protein
MPKITEKPYFAIRESQNGERHPTHEEIEARAYQIYIERGRGDGHDLEDWLQGERELLAEQAETGRISKAAT